MIKILTFEVKMRFTNGRRRRFCVQATSAESAALIARQKVLNELQVQITRAVKPRRKFLTLSK